MLCEIPIPEGWEFVAYRKAEPGERSFDCGKVINWGARGSNTEYIIVRKQWQPPDFLPDGWIAMDKDGEWNWSSGKPGMRHDDWYFRDWCSINKLIWDRPPVTDWQESLREIKRGAK